MCSGGGGSLRRRYWYESPSQKHSSNYEAKQLSLPTGHQYTASNHGEVLDGVAGPDPGAPGRLCLYALLVGMASTRAVAKIFQCPSSFYKLALG